MVYAMREAGEIGPGDRAAAISGDALALPFPRHF